jgi:hypothetical protein
MGSELGYSGTETMSFIVLGSCLVRMRRPSKADGIGCDGVAEYVRSLKFEGEFWATGCLIPCENAF